MKAICVNGPRDISIKQVPYPERKPGDALIKVQSATVCGSDVSAYLGRGKKVDYPLIIGHEIAGTIVEIDCSDAKDTGLKKGDTVVLDPYLYCGKCYPCSLGRTNCCEDLKVLGVQIDGAMSEYFSHPSKQLVKLDSNIRMAVAPIIEPLTIALHAIHRVGLKSGERVAIIGAGPIGLLAAMAAISAYSAEPILIDIIQDRLEYARQLGVKHIVNPSNCNEFEKIYEITGGRMAEAVIEASGSNIAIRNTLDYASYCGRIALTGWPSKEASLLTSTITKKELSINGSRTSVGEFEEAAQLVSSSFVDVEAVLTKTVSFDDMPNAISDMANEPEKYLKIGFVV